MPDSKISALTALTVPNKTDLLPIVDDVAGTPITKKITVGDLIRGGPFVLPAVELVAIQADFTLAAAAGVQNCLSAANDTLTVNALTTYFFDGQYLINTGATTHTTAMAFALGGGASVTSFEYTTMLWSAAANAISTTQSTCHVSGVASKVLNATSTAVWTLITFQGVARINAAGTLTPQIAFSANPTGTNLMKVGSYIRFYPVGSNTVVSVGPWA